VKLDTLQVLYFPQLGIEDRKARGIQAMIVELRVHAVIMMDVKGIIERAA
jgi:hypothetical protein